MTLYSPPTLREAQNQTKELLDDSVADLILIGISRNGAGIYQALCLRPDEDSEQTRRLETYRFFHRGQGQTAVHTVTTGSDGQQSPTNSMMSVRTPRTFKTAQGTVHVVSNGGKLAGVATLFEKGDSDLGSMGKLTAHKDGAVQLFGATMIKDHFVDGEPKQSVYTSLLGNRPKSREEIEGKRGVLGLVPVDQPYRQPVATAGKPGVARVLHTVRGVDAAYGSQPKILPLGPNLASGGIYDVADHLKQLFKPEALAVCYIPLHLPDQPVRIVWNSADPHATGIL